MKNALGSLLTGVGILFWALAASAQPVGQFTSQTDVGNPALAGSAVYDSERESYTVSGAGKNMWLGVDEFHFVWKRMKGDFILQTRAEFLGKGVDAHRKLGCMARSTLETGSPHINAVVHGDGLTSLQFRRKAGAATEELKSSLTAANIIQLERRGEHFTMSVARYGEPFTTVQLDDLALGEEVYVGLFVCSHNPEVIEKAEFTQCASHRSRGEKFRALSRLHWQPAGNSRCGDGAEASSVQHS